MTMHHFFDPHLESVFEYFQFQSLLWLIIGIALGLFGTAFVRWFFPKVGLLDFPHRYGLKRERIPYPGGVWFVLMLPILAVIDVRLAPVALAGLLLGGLSFWDDRHDVSAIVRLVVHILLAALLWSLGVRIDWIGDPFHATNISLAAWPAISFGITVVWIVALQNALNWFDGIKGLATGISSVGFLTLGLLGLLRPELFFDVDHHTTTLASLFLAGLAGGGFWFYLKGKVLLGDSGSQVFGMLLACMAIISGAKIATTLLVLALPLIDFFVVILRRIIVDKKSPISGDLNHSHHLLSRVVGEETTTWMFIGGSLVFGLVAVSLVGFAKMIALGFLGLLVFVCFIGLIKKAIHKG